MEISTITRNSLIFLGYLSTVISFIWFITTISVYWNSPYQAIELYECRWLLSSLVITSFFFYLFINSASSIFFTATYASAQYTFAYSLVSIIFNVINFFHIFTVWSFKNRQEAMNYLRLNAFLGFLSFASVFVTFNLLKNLIKVARSIEQNMQPFERKYQIMFCSMLHLALGLLNFAMCYKLNENVPYSSSFIVQQVCCTFSSLSVAYMQWHFRNACNTHILRAVIIMNVCQFVQEITYAYSTYLLIMLMGRKSDIPASKFNSVDETEVVHLLFASFVIHGIRLITCAYPVNVFGKKAFLAEVLCRIRFRADAQRGISSVQAKQANNTDKNETKLLFYGGLILSTLCIATDVAYYVFSNAKRIGHTGIALIYTICLAFIYYHYRKERRIMFLKLQAVVSIIILNSSIHTIYLFCEAMFTGRLYFTMNRSVENFLINGSYFFLAVSLTVLSAKSIVFCFRTITKHTPLHTQSVTIMGPLRSLTNLAYTLIAIVIVEILFTTIMYKLYSTKIDFLSGNESFLWINSIATCLLQIWVCKHERFQRCVIILIIQLISDCSTILLLILVQAGIVQTIVAMMTRHSKTFQHSSARIIYIVIDHILQIIQWALNIYSLGLALIVLDGVETSDDEFSEGIETRTFENEVFLGQGMREHFIDELLEAPTYSELIISECNPETDRPSCSIFDRSANIDFMWGENNVFFDDETNQGDSNINNDRDTINTNATIEKTSSSNNATESDAIEGNVDSDDIDDSDDDDGDDDDDDDNDNDMNGDDNVDSQSIAVNDEDENFS